MSDRHPFLELLGSCMREFAREPEVIFWVFGFPILLAVGLGIAFRNKPRDIVAVSVIDGPGAEDLGRALSAKDGFQTERTNLEDAQRGLRLGKISLLVVPGNPVEYRFDPTRPESVLARSRVDDSIQRASGRADPVAVREPPSTEPGARYIDFLIPGLLGMNIMSGGMRGLGLLLLQMRARKLLKRLIATPMRRADFLGAIMTSRMILVLGEMALLLFFGWLVFRLVIQGALLTSTLLAGLGAFVFSGLGLRVACPTSTIER